MAERNLEGVAGGTERAPPAAVGSSTLLRPLVLIVDQDYRVAHWSDSCMEWSGCRRDDACGRSLRSALPILVSIEWPLPVEFETEWHRPRQRIAWTATVLRCLGASGYTLVTGVDATERDRARSPGVRGRPILNSSLPMWAFDRCSLAVAAVNDAAARAYGLAPREMIGRAVPEICECDDMPGLLEVLINLDGEVAWTGPWRQRGGHREFDADLGMIATEGAGRPMAVALVATRATRSTWSSI